MIPQIHKGHLMRIAREAVGLEAREMAERIGIAPGTVVSYEKGRTEPKKLALRAWSEVTGVPIWWLEGRTGPDADAPAIAVPANAESRPRGTGSAEKKLLQLDSNQQPAGYSNVPGTVSSIDDKRALTAQRARLSHMPRRIDLEQDAA